MTMSLDETKTSNNEGWDEFLPGTAWCVQNLLKPEECQQVVEAARANGIESLTPSGDLRHRERVVVVLELPEIRDRIWERIRDRIPQEIIVENDTEHPGLLHENKLDLIGRWTLSGLYPKVNVAFCSGKGHLAAHRDADFVLSEHERSFLTINGFLTDRPLGTGGATRFLRDEIVVQGADIPIKEDSDVLYRVESDTAGKSVIFFHGLMHDGEPLAGGDNIPPKWIFRSFVFYKRDPNTAPKLTSEEKQARKLLMEAETAEMDGRINDAIKLYTRAYRLDPSLES